MDVIELTLTKGTELDFQIALVDSPAIESDFMAFKKQQQFKVISEDKRVVSGFAMMAEKPIYRRDDNGQEYYVKFTADSIKEISQQFAKNNLLNQTNAMHQTDNFLDGVYVTESFLIDEQRGISIPKGYGDATEGSWFITMKIENNEVWQSVKDGTFKGFSVEGIFDEKKHDYLSGLKSIVESYQ